MFTINFFAQNGFYQRPSTDLKLFFGFLPTHLRIDKFATQLRNVKLFCLGHMEKSSIFDFGVQASEKYLVSFLPRSRG